MTDDELSLWMKDFILKFREQFDNLSSEEKNQLQDLYNLNKPCQVESFWIRNEELNFDFQFHFFTKFENEKDLKIKVKVLNSQNYIEALEGYLKEKKWNRLLSDSKSSTLKGETYSDRIEIILAMGINNFVVNNLAHSERSISTPMFVMLTIINPENPDVLCWMNIGKIQRKNIEEEVYHIISNIKESKFENISSKSERLEGFGTYFYPPIWIGKHPNAKLKDRVTKKRLIQFSKKVQDIKYKNKILIVNNDGFIAIEGNKKESTNLLNEIMATAILLDIPASMINESELGRVSINLENREIETPHLKVNSMRTNLFKSQYDTFTDIRIDRIELSEKEISGLFNIAEKITNYKIPKTFLIFYLESYTHFQNYLYPQSFLMSWLIIERFLSLLWKKEVINKINGKRKEKLENSVRWSADYIIETLNLLNVVPDENYKQLMRLKKKRNKIVHEGREITKIEAEECLNVAKFILIEELGL